MSSPKFRCSLAIFAILLLIVVTNSNGSGDAEAEADGDKDKDKGAPKLPKIPKLPGSGGGCKSQKAAQVNEEWLLSVSKWYVVYSDELSQSTVTNAAAIPEVKNFAPPLPGKGKGKGKGDKKKKMCWSSDYKLGKEGEKMSPPSLPFSYSCRYDHDVARQACHLKELDDMPEQLAAILGLLPTSMDMILVMTDNKSYLALVSCLSGIFRQFAVVSPSPKGPDAEILKEVKKRFGSMGLATAKDELSKGSKKQLSSDSLGKETIRISNCMGHSNGEKTPLEQLKKLDKIGLSKMAAASRSAASGGDSPPV